jgi:DNA mismatch endonuclease, patch repair protein
MSTDTLSKEKRSRLMSQVRHKDTKPECIVRTTLHKTGFRFRLHAKNLPGTPDIILPKYQTVIFVHGCFWHRHLNCKKATTPKQNASFWREKFERNIQRDMKKTHDLEAIGWRVVIVWECETSKIDELSNKLTIILKEAIQKQETSA